VGVSGTAGGSRTWARHCKWERRSRATLIRERSGPWEGGGGGGGREGPKRPVLKGCWARAALGRAVVVWGAGRGWAEDGEEEAGVAAERAVVRADREEEAGRKWPGGGGLLVGSVASTR